MALVHNLLGPPQAQRVMLLIHGYGADEKDLGGIMPYLDPEGRFLTILPRGPLSAPPGFSWYDIAAVVGSADESADSGFMAALDELDDLLDEVCTARSLNRSEAVIAGFSQGGALALALGLRASARPRPAGVLAMSTYLPEDPGLTYDFLAAQEVPVLIQHGTDDPLIALERGRQVAETLVTAGLPVTFEQYPMGHQVAMESLSSAHEWLLAIETGVKPFAPIPEPPAEPLVKSVTTANFEAEVLRCELPVFVDFWAPWCEPCRQVSPIVEQIAAMRTSSYRVVKVNIDAEPGLAQTYEVKSIPMIGLFRNGQLERSVLGAKPRPQIEAELGMLVIP